MLKLLMNFLPQADIVYVAIFAGVVGCGLWFIHHERAEGAARAVAAVQASSAKLTAENNAALAAKDAANAAAITSLENSYNARLKTSDALTAALNKRLHNFDAGSSQAAVPDDSSATRKPDVPAGVPGSVDSALQGVITAAGHDADKVTALQQFITQVCK